MSKTINYILGFPEDSITDIIYNNLKSNKKTWKKIKKKRSASTPKTYASQSLSPQT